MADKCKSSDCDFVFPIIETDVVGNSLSSINYNFSNLDIQICNMEDDVENKWNPAFTVFSENSGAWIDAITSYAQNSSCFLEAQTTVNEMSAFWLKPITIVYPYPFSSNSDLSVIRAWLMENFPISGGGCFNYIAGQEFLIFSPEYYSITRKVTESKGVGKQTVRFTYTCTCIGKPVVRQTVSKNVDCGTFALELNVQDQFINRFVGIKFTVTPALEWDNGVKIFE